MSNSQNYLPSNPALEQAPADKSAAPPSALQHQATMILSGATSFAAIGKANKAGTAAQILSDADYAEESLLTRSAKHASLANLAKPQLQADKLSSPIQNGQIVFTDAFKQYSDAAKAAGDKAVFKT